MLLPSLDEIDKELCTRSLSHFVAGAWHVVEPGRPYIRGWHIDAISEHLEAATNGEIQNLIVNMPPRHMKSLLVSVFWPMWVWTFRPESRWLFLSYADNLAIRDSLKCRRIIKSNWYQANFGHMFQLTGDQNQKTRFDNDKTGFRIATGVNGGATGEGGEFIVVDDPIKAKDAHSEAVREAANKWWGGTVSTRGNDPESMVRVIVMQRLHQRDLTGFVLDQMRNGGTPYELLCLPAEYEPNRCMLTTGWTDPRKEEGELLWPERFSQKTIDRLKRELGDEAPGQLQQRPTAAEGGIFQKSWWAEGRNRYHLSNALINNSVIARWLMFDTAFKDKASNDPSACAVVELWPDYSIGIRHMWQERIQAALLPGKIEQLATRYNQDGKLRSVVIEDKGSGTTSIQTLRMSAPTWLANMITEFMPTGTKEYRGRLASVWCERNCVKFPYPDNSNGDWYNEFLDDDQGQLFMFPNAAHDDLTDCLTMAVIFLEHYISDGYQARQGQFN
jgi:phage terminase large subunit-like protein